MFLRIKTLTLLQLSERFKFKKVENVKRLIGRIGKLFLGFVLVTAVVTLLFYLLHSVVFVVTPKIITFIIVFLQILSIVACSVGLLRTLYASKDNMILLSYPAKHFEVFMSKLLVYYIYEFIKSIFITLPIILGFGFVYGFFDFMYLISAIIITIILPIFPVLIGAIITIPILYIKKLINRYFILETLLLFVSLIGLFALFFFILTLIPRPLGIIEMYTSFVKLITKLITAVDSYSLFYQFVGNIFTNNNILLNYLFLILIMIGMVLLVALLSMPIFFKLASSSSEMATEKKRRKENKMHKNTFFTFVKKEWLLSVRNFGKFINDYIFLFATPYVLFIMMGIFTSISLTEFGVYMTVVFSGFVTLLMCCASNTDSALAITKEGSEFVLLKTVPANSANMVWAKIFFNLIYSTLMIIISFVLVIVFCPMFDTTTTGYHWPWLIDNSWLWAMMVAVLFINSGMIFWSLQIDIMNPKLREYATSGDTSGMSNGSKSILIGLIVAVVFTVFCLFVLTDSKNMVLNWSIIIGASAIFMIARLYLFNSYLNNVFPYIEY